MSRPLGSTSPCRQALHTTAPRRLSVNATPDGESLLLMVAEAWTPSSRHRSGPNAGSGPLNVSVLTTSAAARKEDSPLPDVSET